MGKSSTVCTVIQYCNLNCFAVKRYLSAGGFMIPGDQFMKSFLAFVLKIHSESDDLEGDGSETKRIGKKMVVQIMGNCSARQCVLK